MFLGRVLKLRSKIWDVTKTHCSSLQRFLPAPLGQIPVSCWTSLLLPESLSLSCHLPHHIRDLGKSLGCCWAEASLLECCLFVKELQHPKQEQRQTGNIHHCRHQEKSCWSCGKHPLTPVASLLSPDDFARRGSHGPDKAHIETQLPNNEGKKNQPKKSAMFESLQLLSKRVSSFPAPRQALGS